MDQNISSKTSSAGYHKLTDRPGADPEVECVPGGEGHVGDYQVT